MLDFKKSFGSSFIFSSDRKRTTYLEKKPIGLYTTVEVSSSIEIDLPYHGFLSNTEKDNIEEQLGRLYIYCWEDDVLGLRAIPAKKTYMGFKGLGIAGYIDFLATTNHFRVTKTSGLFSKVLEHLGISPGDMAYIGDNEQRDMTPAMAEAIFSIHLAEKKHVSLNTLPPQVNTLRKLQCILLNDSL